MDVLDSDEEADSDSDEDPEVSKEDEPIERILLTSRTILAAVATTEPEYELEIYDSGTTQQMTLSRD
jgi:hypothetical protein